MLMDNGTEQAAGIRHMEFYVPETRYSMREYARVKPAEFTQESLEQTWRDIAIEPEILFRYFSARPKWRSSSGRAASPVSTVRGTKTVPIWLCGWAGKFWTTNPA
jgi:hypothetical protein